MRVFVFVLYFPLSIIVMQTNYDRVIHDLTVGHNKAVILYKILLD